MQERRKSTANALTHWYPGHVCQTSRNIEQSGWDGCCNLGYPSPIHETNLNTLRPRQNGCQYPDDIFKCIYLNENIYISIKISLKFVPNGRINNIPALSAPMVHSLVTHLCITRPQWVNSNLMKSRFHRASISFSNRLARLRSVWQYHCRVLWKIKK